LRYASETFCALPASISIENYANVVHDNYNDKVSIVGAGTVGSVIAETGNISNPDSRNFHLADMADPTQLLITNGEMDDNTIVNFIDSEGDFTYVSTGGDMTLYHTP